MPHTPGQNAGKQAITVPDAEFWRDFERMQSLPDGFRKWLEFEANDTYLIGPIFQYRDWHGRTFGELEAFMRHYSREQYIEDYAWTGETPPQKGKTNECMSELRATSAFDRQPRKAAIQMQPTSRKRRRLASLALQPVDNDADYFEW